MRFSIKTLIALLLLSALAVSAYSSRISARGKLVQEYQLHAMLAQQALSLENARRQSESQLRALREAKLRGETYRQLQVTLVQKFTEISRELSELKLTPDQISVREVPTLSQANQFLKQFSIFIPDDHHAVLDVSMQPVSGQLTNWHPEYDFDGETRVETRLRSGMHRIEFRFEFLQGRPIFSCAVDGQPAATFTFLGDPRGSSHSTLNFSEQRDYVSGDESPIILRYAPVPGDTALEARLVLAFTSQDNQP